MPMDKNKMVVDLEKGMQEAMGAARGEKEPMVVVPDLRVLPQIERGVVADHGLKKWLPAYWVITGTVIVLTNHINAAPKYQLVPPAVFVVFVCAVCFMFGALKQMM